MISTSHHHAHRHSHDDRCWDEGGGQSRHGSGGVGGMTEQHREQTIGRSQHDLFIHDDDEKFNDDYSGPQCNVTTHTDHHRISYSYGAGDALVDEDNDYSNSNDYENNGDDASGNKLEEPYYESDTHHEQWQSQQSNLYHTEDDEYSKENQDDNINTNSENENYHYNAKVRGQTVKYNSQLDYSYSSLEYDNEGNDDICANEDGQSGSTSHLNDDDRSYQGDDNNDLMDANEVHERGWPMDGVDFNQIQRPQSMIFNEDEEEDWYDEDNAHLDQGEQLSVPVKEVEFAHEQDDDTEYEQFESANDNARDEQQYYSDHSSVVGDGSDADCEERRDQCTKPSTEQIFHSSDSLDVVQRIESVMESLVNFLDRKEEPIMSGYVKPESYDDEEEDSVSHDDAMAALRRMTKSNGDPKFSRSFGNIAQSRSFTSLCLVMSFVHQLLLSNRTTTTREVYYVFVTHFRNQRECDGVILDLAKLLSVSRRSLGLSASPKGWFCGCVEIIRKGTLPSGKDVSGSIDGTALSSIQGLPITREWTERDKSGRTDDGVEIKVTSKNAKVILVVEKEGVYNRLSEERIFDRFPCILVTGKGFPDLATRALVSTLHNELELPVVGLCDCNPYGISVLALYHYAGDRMGVDGRSRYSVPMQWLGFRPSEVARLKDDLPETVFQKLTDLDNKRCASLLDPDHSFLTEEDEDEVRDMRENGYKVELEALYWLGPDYMGNWVVKMLKDEYEAF